MTVTKCEIAKEFNVPLEYIIVVSYETESQNVDVGGRPFGKWWRYEKNYRFKNSIDAYE